MVLFVRNTYGPDTPVLKTYRNPAWLYSHMTVYCRILGPLTMVAIWALCVTGFIGFYPTSAIYLLFLGILLIFQEFDWLFSKLSCTRSDHWVGMCWRGFVWFDDWKRSLEYFILAVFAFVIGGFSSWPLFVGGGVLLLLSIFYGLKARRYASIEPLRLPGDKSLENPAFTGVASAPPAPSAEWGTPGSKY